MLAVVMLCWWEMMLLKQQEFLPTLQGLWLQLPHQNPLCSLCFYPNSSLTGSWGKKESCDFLTRDRGDFLPAAHGKTFGLEEQEDPGAEQRQTALTTHGMCRMLSLASLKSLKLGNRACSSHSCQEQPHTGDSLEHPVPSRASSGQRHSSGCPWDSLIPTLSPSWQEFQQQTPPGRA